MEQSDLNNVFDQLETHAEALLQVQKKHRNYMIGIVLLFTTLLCLVLYFNPFFGSWIFGIVFSLLFLACLFFIPVYISALSLKNKYFDAYKERLCSPLFKNHYPDNKYQSKSIISQNLIQYSKMLEDAEILEYTGEDLMEGKIDLKTFKYSRIKVSGVDGEIFHGLFYMAEKKKDINTTHVLLPRNFQTDFKNIKPVVFKDEKFSTQFQCYSNHEIETYDRFSSDSRKLILGMNDKLLESLRISRIKNYLFILIPWQENFIQTKLALKPSEQEKIHLVNEQIEFCKALTNAWN